jgi:hypothetical protein
MSIEASARMPTVITGCGKLRFGMGRSISRRATNFVYCCSVNLSMDVPNAIHGLEVSPYSS